jgi:glutathione synthase
MRIAFVVADVAQQSPTFGTLYLARAALRRGHDVSFIGVDDLTFAPDNRVLAMALAPAGAPATTAQLAQILARPDARRTDVDLGRYDVVFLRYNPTREGRNGGTPPAGPGPKINPAVEFGWRLRLGGTLVVNDPEGIQRAGGRMYLAGLPQEIRPRTLITRSDDAVRKFLKRLDGPAIVKPLSGGGVEGVFFVERRRNPNLNQILQAVKKSGYVIVQEYIKQAREGDKRLLLLGGRPVARGGRVAIYRRVRPGETPDARHPHAHGRAERRPCEFGPEEQRIVDLVRPKLLGDGLYFVGIDIVGGVVLEVNVHTPGGLHANSELYDLDVGEIVIRDLERRVSVRAAYGAAALPPVL